jgi:hypothetical protein
MTSDPSPTESPGTDTPTAIKSDPVPTESPGTDAPTAIKSDPAPTPQWLCDYLQCPVAARQAPSNPPFDGY